MSTVLRPIGVHVLSESVFCPRAGVLAWESGEDTGDEEPSLGPRLDDFLDYDEGRFAEELRVAWGSLRRWLAFFPFAGVLTAIVWCTISPLMGVVSSVLLFVLAALSWDTAVRIVQLIRERMRFEAAAPAAIDLGAPTKLASRVARLTPAYRPGSVEADALLVAGIATLAWLVAIPLFPRAKTRPVLVWATGMVLSWTLIAALFRPWVEAGWGYRPLIKDLARHLPPGACLSTQVDAPMAVMLRYHLKAPVASGCPFILVLASRETERKTKRRSGAEAVLWEGSRPRYKSQVYRLEKRAQD